jgi:hypothetical protein
MPAPDFRDRLCELEPFNAQLRARYEENLKNLMEHKLSPISKRFFFCVGIGSLVLAVYLGTLAFLHNELPPLARLGMAAGSAFSIAWVVLMGWTLKKGVWFGKIQPTIIAGLSWTFAVFLETCFLVLAPQFPDKYVGTVVIISGLVLLIGAGVGLLGTRMQQTELTMREAFLRLEYRLAQLAEELKKSREPD